MTGPLDGVRVVEAASFLAAPAAASLMADMGASVIKIEPPSGDLYRGNQRGLDGQRNMNYSFEVDNRGKRSIALDFNLPEGLETARRLIGSAEIFVTNLSPERLSRYGLTFQAIKAVQPRIVYTHLTSYGSEGSDAWRPGFDSNAYWAKAGIMSLAGEEGTPAVQGRAGQGDHPTALGLVAGTLAAMRVRDMTGEAQYVEVSLLRMGVWTNATDMQVALNVPDRELTRFNRATHALVTRSAYETRDGRWIMLTMHDIPRFWPRFCRALGRENWSDDARFNTNTALMQNGASITNDIQDIFKQHDLAYWAQALDETNCIWAPAATLAEVAVDPQLRDYGAFEQLEDANGRPYEVVAAPFQVSGAYIRPRSRAPLVGEHNYEVLIEAGFTPEELVELAAQRAFG